MFKENKYTKIYFALIEKRKTAPILKEEVYCESHHIIPKSLGGTNESDNLINLLPREHFLAHLLLTKMVIQEGHIIKMHWALHKMCYGNVEYFSARDYEWYRQRHIKFLKEHHPSKQAAWRQRVSERVLRDWQNNYEQRRDIFKTSIKKWRDDNPEEFLENCRRNAKLGNQAARMSIIKKLEYNGTMYLGWNELKDQTGVSKFLYNKFYKHGIDPTFRIGKDGIMNRSDIDNLIKMFCSRNHMNIPMKQKDIDEVLQRMYNIGLISSREMEAYKQSIGKENR